ncbi:SirB2 family protein [Cellvibrio sp. PSBB023]|uniref:SirB2 family protein n=1 Tax=Cellvibrio sp. PSBB023 TaxID=1945512 RepID=UPI00098F2FBF|nr:SirB2 family protein [Cellvibrio sp. PSBB023]AQT59267.1 regulator SirB [Cellvibrio sp. PSBB023]
MYIALKHLHLTFVALALLIFFVRGVLLFINSPLLNKKLLKIAPHIINTIMLVSGILLAVSLGMKPGEHPWLMAKLIGLVVFIILGVGAFKVRNVLLQKILWVDALVVFAYIVSVAITKSPMGFLG